MLTALFTGQFRTPDVVRRSVASLLALREAGVLCHCVVATWDADADSFRAALAPLNPTVIVCRPPRYELSFNNIMHQRVALRDGLAACPDGWILKLRADTWIDAGLVRRVLTALAAMPPGDALPLFRRRMWVPWIDYEEPFHVADECLIGDRGDMLRLARLDITALVEYGHPLVNVHTQAFLPERGAYPGTYFAYLAAQRDADVLLNDNTEAKFAKLALAERDPAYQTVLGVWYRTIFDSFLCFSAPDEVAFHPGGGGPASYYTTRKALPDDPDRLFTREAAGFFNHYYIWDLDSFRTRLGGLHRPTFDPLLAAIETPSAVGDHAATLRGLMETIRRAAPPGPEPFPGPITWVRRRVRRFLQRLLKAVG